MGGMQVTQGNRAGWQLISVTGQVDTSTADSLAATLRETIASHEQVAVDCSGIDFIGSAGIGALVEGAAAARRTGHRFSICTPSPRVEQMIRLCKLETVLTIEPTLPG